MIPAQPSRTALRVALRRAAHQVMDGKPLVFEDPFAVSILGPEAQEELGRTPKASRKPFSAALRAWVVARARLAEDLLAAGTTSSRNRQYLILGAGLDTFALRNPFSEVQVFEVDHPATQAWKRERLQASGLHLPSSAHLVAVDFESQSLQEELLRSGFDLHLPTFTAWLGVVPYLTPEAFAGTCRFLAQLPPRSGVVFDYIQPRESLPPVEQLMHDSLAARVAQAGEPFRLHFTPETLRKELRQHDLRIVEDLGGDELNQRYFRHRSDGLQVRGSAGRVCHAETLAGSSTECENRSVL